MAENFKNVEIEAFVTNFEGERVLLRISGDDAQIVADELVRTATKAKNLTMDEMRQKAAPPYSVRGPRHQKGWVAPDGHTRILEDRSSNCVSWCSQCRRDADLGLRG